jgi:hypothetical protein
VFSLWRRFVRLATVDLLHNTRLLNRVSMTMTDILLCSEDFHQFVI